MNIVTACDDAYAQHCTVFLKSLFAQNPSPELRVFVLVPDAFTQSQSIERNLGGYRKQLEFVNVESYGTTTGFKISDHVTAATYYRLFLDRLLPSDVTRIIYLDSDMVVTGSLQELWTKDLGGRVIAAAIDPGGDADHLVREKVGLRNNSHYFNAGVLLIDLARWRYEAVGARAHAFAVEHPELLTYWDQCALNHVLNGQFLMLPKEWNFQTDHLQWVGPGKCSAQTLQELESAKIIHFTGKRKPWFYLVEHPAKKLYWDLLRHTEWRNYREPDKTVRNVIKKTLEDWSPSLFNRVQRSGLLRQRN